MYVNHLSSNAILVITTSKLAFLVEHRRASALSDFADNSIELTNLFPSCNHTRNVRQLLLLSCVLLFSRCILQHFLDGDLRRCKSLSPTQDTAPPPLTPQSDNFFSLPPDLIIVYYVCIQRFSAAHVCTPVACRRTIWWCVLVPFCAYISKRLRTKSSLPFPILDL